MSVQEQIIKQEKALKTFKNSLAFAEKAQNKHRQGRFKKLVQNTEVKIKELESKLPVESNERLREIIDGLREEIKQEKEERKADAEKFEERIKRFEDALNPPKKPEPKEDTVMKECPKCGRSIKGKSAMTAHQRYHCKKAH